MGWLQPYGRLDGLFWRVVPVADPPLAIETLRANLLERYGYRGYADPAVELDDVSRLMGRMYAIPFMALMREEARLGAAGRCRDAAERYVGGFPPQRLGGDVPRPAEAAGVCGS
jgi:hypothetical protein